MSRLTWDNAGERYYETGVKQGVLYIPTGGVYLEQKRPLCMLTTLSI